LVIVLGITHAAAGLAIASFFPIQSVAVFGFAVLGALLPDIDHPSSYLGRYFKSLKWFTKHRAFFHSIIAAVLFTVAVHAMNVQIGWPVTYSFAFLFGYLSHLGLDAWTKEGITPFYPVNLRVKGKRKVGSLSEYVLLVLLVIVSLA